MTGSRSKRGKLRDPRKRRLMRVQLMQRDGRHCHWCGDRLAWEEMTIDHVIDLADGGSNATSNLVLACQPCNSARGHENDLMRRKMREMCYSAEISQIIARQVTRRL